MKAFAFPVFAGLLLLLAAGCDGGSEDLFFVFISNAWEDQADPAHVFNFNALSGDGTPTGTFDGNEVDGVDFFSLVGSWSNNRISFTVDRTAGPVTFSGEIRQDDPSTLSLNSSAGSLVLSKQANP